MVQLVPDQVDAKPDRVRSFRPAGVGDVSVHTVIAHHRTPVIHIPEGGVPRNVEDREAALPRIGTIGSRNLENVRTVVGSEIRPLRIVMHTASAEVGVEEEIWRYNVVHAASEILGQLVSRSDPR